MYFLSAFKKLHPSHQESNFICSKRTVQVKYKQKQKHSL